MGALRSGPALCFTLLVWSVFFGSFAIRSSPLFYSLGPVRSGLSVSLVHSHRWPSSHSRPLLLGGISLRNWYPLSSGVVTCSHVGPVRHTQVRKVHYESRVMLIVMNATRAVHYFDGPPFIVPKNISDDESRSVGGSSVGPISWVNVCAYRWNSVQSGASIYILVMFYNKARKSNRQEEFGIDLRYTKCNSYTLR